MPLKNQVVGPNPVLFSKKLQATLDLIQGAVGASDAVFCEMLGVAGTQLSKIRRQESQFELSHLESLSMCLDLSINHLFSGAIDYKALAKRFHGDTAVLPERYQVPEHRLSPIRSTSCVLRYLDVVHGSAYTRQILRRLQVNPVALSTADGNISSLFNVDLLAELLGDGISAEQIRETGTLCVTHYESTEFGKTLSRQKSSADIYLSAFEDSDNVRDRHCTVRLLALHPKGCTLELKPRPEVQEAFKTKLLGNRESCMFKQGFMLSLPGFIKNRFARLVETKCMYWGDKRCVYHLSWR